MKKLFSLLIVFTFIFGCATFQDLSPEKQLTYTRVEFNAVVEQYIKYYNSVSEDEQTKLKADVDQKILDAIEVLDMWELALSINDIRKAKDKERLFISIKNEILKRITPLITGG